MNPAKGKASAAAVSRTIWPWMNCPPALFRIILKKHMTVPSNAFPEWSARKADV